MEFAETDVSTIVKCIWESVFGMLLEETEGPPSEALAVPQDREVMTGCVHITGFWEGAVMVQCPVALARRMASRMFAADEAELSTDDVRDALGEVANMTGGSLKNLVPGQCFLSLPTVAEGDDHAMTVQRSRLVTHVSLRCEEHPVRVFLVEKLPSPRAVQGVVERMP